MRKYVKFIVGVLLLFVGCFCAVQLVKGALTQKMDETAARLRDNAVSTTGTITGRYQHTSTARGGSVYVTKDQALAVGDGAPIRIK